MSFVTELYYPDSVIVRVGKALDVRNAADFKKICHGEVSAGARNFILDFSETGILDSTGLGAIFSLYKLASRFNGEVVFASLSKSVRVTVQFTRIYRVFDLYPSVQAACKALTQPSAGTATSGVRRQGRYGTSI